jgi:ribosomal protein L7/L12
MDLIQFVNSLPESSFAELREAVNTRLGLVNSELTDGEKEMVREKSRVIECIKAVRVRTGLGLKEAKDMVDRFRASPEYSYWIVD